MQDPMRKRKNEAVFADSCVSEAQVKEKEASPVLINTQDYKLHFKGSVPEDRRTGGGGWGGVHGVVAEELLMKFFVSKKTVRN